MRVRLLCLPDRPSLESEFDRIGVDPGGRPILAGKSQTLVLKLTGLSIAAANIFKQSALAVGADCAVPRDVITGRATRCDLLVLATPRQVEKILEKVSYQPLPLAELADEVRRVLALPGNPPALVLGGQRIAGGTRTRIMGVVNITPDSFSDGGRFLDPAAAGDQARRLVDEGADLVDLGAESTRPGAAPVSAAEEVQRLLPVLEGLAGRVGVPISVDTTKAAVADAVLGAGAVMVNDISGLHADPELAPVIARHRAACVIMHIKGTPRTMQQSPVYDDLLAEVTDYLAAGLETARAAGIDPEKTVVDPGIGFGKTAADNCVLLRRLAELQTLGRPIMVGASRKSFIGHYLDLPVDDRLEGSLAAAVWAAANGAAWLRVHDVRATRRALALTDAITGRR